jgi:hypothetical protein
MRAVQLAFMIIIMNLSASIMIQADFFGGGDGYYESEVVNYALKSDSDSNTLLTSLKSVPVIGEIVQVATMLAMLQGLFSVLGFGWVSGILPVFITATPIYGYIILAFNSILAILIIVAVMELVSKQWGSLK